MRLMQRTTVDLPEPDGPISAVALLGAKESESDLIAWRSPDQASRPSIATDRDGAPDGSSARLVTSGSRPGVSGGGVSGRGSGPSSSLTAVGSCGAEGGQSPSGS